MYYALGIMGSARLKRDWMPLDFCAPKDGYGIAAHGLANLVRLSQSQDPKQVKEALQAATFLVEYGERVMAQKAARAPEPVKAFQQTRSDLLLELKGLYAKALGTPPLVVEAESAESVPDPLNRH